MPEPLSYRRVVEQYPQVTHDKDGPARRCSYPVRRETRYQLVKQGPNCKVSARYKFVEPPSANRQRFGEPTTPEVWYCWGHLSCRILTPGRPQWKKFVAWGYRRGFLTRDGELNEYQVPLEERRAAGL